MGKLSDEFKYRGEKVLRVSLGILGFNILLSPLWVSVGAGIAMDMQNKTLEKIDDSQFEKYREYMNTTRFGNIIRFETDKNPIPVVLGENITGDVKSKIVDAINDFDDISTNVNYTIYDGNANESTAKYIKFNVVDDFSNYGLNNFKGGVTTAGHIENDKFNLNPFNKKEDEGPKPGEIRFDNLKATISFPITITLDGQYADKYWDDEKTQSMLDTIVKRELMRTLGYNFTNDTKLKDSTVMWSNLDETVHDLTDSDIEMVQYCYDGKVVASTQKSKKFDIYYFKKQPVISKKETHDNEIDFTNC